MLLLFKLLGAKLLVPWSKLWALQMSMTLATSLRLVEVVVV